ncbi:MAG: dephospho-CoA kinase, partial [Marinoscillum sp.]
MPGAKPYTVGVTGGIGAGKSMVTKVFSTLGIPTYDADTQAKKLMKSNAGLKTAITNLFGAQAYQDDLLNRK